MSTSLHRRIVFWLTVCALTIAPARTALRLKLDPDIWWHLRVGERIVQERSLPETDTFSQQGLEENRPWIAYSWLFEVILYAFYSGFDLVGISLFRYLLVFMTVVTLLWYVLRGTDQSIGVRLLLFLVFITNLRITTERPWHFTIVFTALTLDAICRMRAGESVRRFWWLPLIYVLWANLHIQFVLGLGLLGMALFVSVVNRARGCLPSRDAWHAIRGWLTLLLLCGVATLITPYHFKLYGVVYEYATQTAPLSFVEELMPPSFRRWDNWVLIGLLVMAGAAVVRRRFPLWDVLLLAVGAFFSLRMQRDIWFGALSAATILVRSPNLNVDTLRSTKITGTGSDGFEAPVPVILVPLAEARPALSFKLLLLVCTAGFLVVAIGWNVGPTPALSLAELRKVEAEDYPVDAVRYVREHRLQGPLFNNFNWGGYLIWNLRELPVCVDGRTNLYGEEYLQRSFDTWMAKTGWEEDPHLRNARLIFAQRIQPLTQKLLDSPRWQAVYEDDKAVVLIPSEPTSATSTNEP